MRYGINRIGYYEKEKCSECEWEGFRSELEKQYVYEEDADYEEDNPLDEHWVCPHCKAIIIH